MPTLTRAKSCWQKKNQPAAIAIAVTVSSQDNIMASLPQNNTVDDDDNMVVDEENYMNDNNVTVLTQKRKRQLGVPDGVSKSCECVQGCVW